MQETSFCREPSKKRLNKQPLKKTAPTQNGTTHFQARDESKCPEQKEDEEVRIRPWHGDLDAGKEAEDGVNVGRWWRVAASIFSSTGSRGEAAGRAGSPLGDAWTRTAVAQGEGQRGGRGRGRRKRKVDPWTSCALLGLKPSLPT